MCQRREEVEQKGRRIFYPCLEGGGNGGLVVDGMARIGGEVSDRCRLSPSLAIHPSGGSMGAILTWSEACVA